MLLMDYPGTISNDSMVLIFAQTPMSVRGLQTEMEPFIFRRFDRSYATARVKHQLEEAIEAYRDRIRSLLFWMASLGI